MSQLVPEIATIKHRTASGMLDQWWEFLPRAGFPEKPNRILASIRLASAIAIEVEIPVCSNRNMMPDHWIIVRRGEHHWLLTAAKLPLDMIKIARSKAFHKDLPVGSIVLSEAPEHVCAELVVI